LRLWRETHWRIQNQPIVNASERLLLAVVTSGMGTSLKLLQCYPSRTGNRCSHLSALTHLDIGGYPRPATVLKSTPLLCTYGLWALPIAADV
jgi:hypothetical protein